MRGTSTTKRLAPLLLLPAIAGSAHAGNGPESAPVPLPVFRSGPLAKNAFRLDFGATYTRYDDTSVAEAQQQALDHGTFETFDHTVLGTVALDYGYLDDVTVGASIGYFLGSDLVRTERVRPASVVTSESDPDGLTDLWLTASWLFDRKLGLTAIGGLELPVGEHGQSGSDGEPVSISSQPSDDAFGARFGLAWSTPQTEPWSVGLSAVYTLRTEHEGASLGDRIDYGAALTWRSSKSFEWSAEISGASLQRDDLVSGEDPNTGGDVIFASAGVRWRFAENVELTLAPAVPLYADLDGAQAEARFRMSTGLSVSF